MVIVTGFAWELFCIKVLLEFCNGGSLKSYIQSGKDFPYKLQVSIMLGVARGLLHLHTYKVIHRDIAARNVLVCIRSDFTKSEAHC